MDGARSRSEIESGQSENYYDHADNNDFDEDDGVSGTGRDLSSYNRSQKS